MKIAFKIFFFFLISLFLFSCESNRIYEKDLRLDEAEWERENKAIFELNIEDSIPYYNLYINFRHAGNYQYRNLYLFSKIIGPAELAAVDTVQMILADSRGNWNGKGIGDLYDYKFLFKKNVLFPRKGKYIISLEQGMRDSVLKNVTDIGIRLEKVEN